MADPPSREDPLWLPDSVFPQRPYMSGGSTNPPWGPALTTTSPPETLNPTPPSWGFCVTYKCGGATNTCPGDAATTTFGQNALRYHPSQNEPALADCSPTPRPGPTRQLSRFVTLASVPLPPCPRFPTEAHTSLS